MPLAQPKSSVQFWKLALDLCAFKGVVYVLVEFRPLWCVPRLATVI